MSHGLIVGQAKERIAQAKHRSRVLQKVAQELSTRYIRALEKALKARGLISVFTRDRVLDDLDRVYAKMDQELCDETAYDQYSAEVRVDEMREARIDKALDEQIKAHLKEKAGGVQR